jgi:hypothetical protein
VAARERASISPLASAAGRELSVVLFASDSFEYHEPRVYALPSTRRVSQIQGREGLHGTASGGGTMAASATALVISDREIRIPISASVSRPITER